MVLREFESNLSKSIYTTENRLWPEFLEIYNMQEIIPNKQPREEFFSHLSSREYFCHHNK